MNKMLKATLISLAKQCNKLDTNLRTSKHTMMTDYQALVGAKQILTDQARQQEFAKNELQRREQEVAKREAALLMCHSGPLSTATHSGATTSTAFTNAHPDEEEMTDLVVVMSDNDLDMGLDLDLDLACEDVLDQAQQQQFDAAPQPPPPPKCHHHLCFHTVFPYDIEEDGSPVLQCPLCGVCMALPA
jgi:hypothetical protein